MFELIYFSVLIFFLPYYDLDLDLAFDLDESCYFNLDCLTLAAFNPRNVSKTPFRDGEIYFPLHVCDNCFYDYVYADYFFDYASECKLELVLCTTQCMRNESLEMASKKRSTPSLYKCCITVLETAGPRLMWETRASRNNRKWTTDDSSVAWQLPFLASVTTIWISFVSPLLISLFLMSSESSYDDASST